VLCAALEPGDVVVMDNLSSHKVSGVREMIEEAGAEVLYSPPYSPDLNPIEKAWSKIKQLLRADKPPAASRRAAHRRTRINLRRPDRSLRLARNATRFITRIVAPILHLAAAATHALSQQPEPGMAALPACWPPLPVFYPQL